MHCSLSFIILLQYQPQVFAGLRKNSHGDGTLALPGGHLELYESWEQCAIRETLEETGLTIHNVQFGHVTNDPMQDQGKHYVTIIMMGECTCSETRPQNLEPHKCEGWSSYTWDELCLIAADGKESVDSECKSSNEDGKNGSSTPILFGPLVKLVEEAPQSVLDFFHK